MACVCPAAKLSAAGVVFWSRCHRTEGHRLRVSESLFDTHFTSRFRKFLTPRCSQPHAQDHQSLSSVHRLQGCNLHEVCCRPSDLLRHRSSLHSKRDLQSVRSLAAASSPSAEPHKPASEDSVLQVVHALQDNSTANQTAAALIAQLDGKGREVILSALFQTASENIDDVFKTVDVNHDGILSKDEFSGYVEAQALEMGKSMRPPTQRQLFLLSLRAAIGNIGFGFTDNVIMILAGDVIQNSIGTGLGLSTLMSAGLGNCIADVIGAAFKESIEGASSHFMPDPKASPFQMATKEAWWAETTGASVGIAAGCILGLSPLFVMGRWRAVDEVEVLDKSTPGLTVTMDDSTPKVASIIAGASWGGSGGPSSAEGAGEAFRGLIGESARSGEEISESKAIDRIGLPSTRSRVSHVTAVVEVPQGIPRSQRALDRFAGVWMLLAMAVLMCIRRLYDYRRRRLSTRRGADRLGFGPSLQ
ncbi:hypothetical protein KFL_001580010 [Klebsormidium nitens]|uniref:EF-hand domain-containing protein n=1 Tax=Klebsormidium nitens TaxID=105231 RepID=A0A1Y1I4M4_KLENI|nr:hypothetical protein KFL_001580010 [Klebsormidium nitens]|eukprot:GAQ83687.1 hypothetical protein KFL_001580010 [Klebsormidium nitens]